MRASISLFSALVVVFLAPCRVRAQLVTPAQRAHFRSDYTRYTVPEECHMAFRRAESKAGDRLHPVDLDTLPYLPKGLPIATSVANEMRSCMAHMSATALPDHEFPSLITGYLLAGQPDLARTAMTARLATLAARKPSSVPIRADLLRDVMLATLSDDPSARKWPSFADTLTEMLDALGSAVNVQRQDVHVRRKDYAWAIADFPAVVRESESVIALGHAIPDAEQSETTTGNIAGAYLTLMGYALVQGNTTDSTSVAGKMARSISNRLQADAPLLGAHLPPYIFDLYRVLDKEIFQGWPGAAPPLHGTFWFNRPDTLARPGAARVTAVVLQDAYPEQLMVLRRLTQQYQHAGFEMVLTAKTRGWFDRSLVLTPPQEADSLRDHFVRDLALPAILAVERTDFVTRTSDGVQMPQPTPNDVQAESGVPNFGLYRGHTLVTAMLWTVGGLEPRRQNEAALRHLIARLLQ